MRVGRVPQHARSAPRRQRRPAAAARARARRRRRAGARRRHRDARLPRRRRRARRATRSRPATSARSTPTATCTCTAACGNRVHHQLRPQRVAGMGRVRDRRSDSAAGRCWSTARRGPYVVALVGASAHEVPDAAVDARHRRGECRAAELRAGAPLGARAATLSRRGRHADGQRPAAPPRNPRTPRRAARRPLPRRTRVLTILRNPPMHLYEQLQPRHRSPTATTCWPRRSSSARSPATSRASSTSRS